MAGLRALLDEDTSTPEWRNKEERPGLDPCGWPPDPRERRDFYHRIRAFPPAISRWRKWLVNQIVRNRESFPGIPPDATPVQVRALVDDGISYVREVTRILALLYGNPQLASAEKQNIFTNAATTRVFARLGPYRELGITTERLEHGKLPVPLPDLVPPSLRNGSAVQVMLAGKCCSVTC